MSSIKALLRAWRNLKLTNGDLPFSKTWYGKAYGDPQWYVLCVQLRAKKIIWIEGDMRPAEICIDEFLNESFWHEIFRQTMGKEKYNEIVEYCIQWSYYV